MTKGSHRKLLALAAMSALTLSLQSGCVVLLAGAAAGGAVAYVKGDMTYVLPCSLKKAQKATQRALEKDLKIQIKSTKFGENGSVVYEANTSLGGDATIKLEAFNDDTTKISIRVGMFGDEDKSRIILDAIRKRAD